MWAQTTPDEASELLREWIAGIDDPHEIARLLLIVCGCKRVAVSDDGQTISYEKDEE